MRPALRLLQSRIPYYMLSTLRFSNYRRPMRQCQSGLRGQFAANRGREQQDGAGAGRCKNRENHLGD